MNKVSSPNLFIEMGIPENQVQLVIKCIGNAWRMYSSEGRNGYYPKAYNRDWKPQATLWREDALVTSGMEYRSGPINNGPKYVMSKSEAETKLVDSSKPSDSTPAPSVDVKEENWDQRLHGSTSTNSRHNSFRERSQQSSARSFSRRGPAGERRGELCPTNQSGETSNQQEHESLPTSNSIPADSPKPAAQSNQKRSSQSTRCKFSSEQSESSESAKFSVIVRRTNSERIRPGPGEDGWLASEVEFPSMGGSAPKEEAKSEEAKVTSSQPTPRSSPDLEREENFRQQKRSESGISAAPQVRPTSLPRIPPVTLQTEVSPPFPISLVSPSPPTHNPASFFGGHPFLSQACALRHPYSMLHPFPHPGSQQTMLVHQPQVGNGQMLIGGFPDAYSKIPIPLYGGTGANHLRTPLQLPPLYSAMSSSRDHWKSQAPRGGGQFSCANCGRTGHQHQNCSEPTFEEITKAGNFSLNVEAEAGEEQESSGELGVSGQDAEKHS